MYTSERGGGVRLCNEGGYEVAVLLQTFLKRNSQRGTRIPIRLRPITTANKIGAHIFVYPLS